jgi:aminopeptidase
MTLDEFLTRYADVVTAVGLNVQRGQEVYVRAPLEASAFVPHVVRSAYRRGARFVHVEYRQQAVTRARLEDAPAESLDYVPRGTLAERLRVVRDGGASLAILGEDPMGLEGVDPGRQATATRALAAASTELRELAMKDHHPWCVISIPNDIWAARVYPGVDPPEALARLTDAAAHACRLDTPDPVAAWTEHSGRLMRLAAWLTGQAFGRFDYRAPGTELSVGMPERHHWIGTEGRSADGITFIANLPTDEVFCAPDWRRVDGTLRSTRPLIAGGTNLGRVDFTVRQGRIVEARAERGQEILDHELDLDERARYFGEVALVSEDAPIAELGTTFYDGLYDENAGCHFAFGNAYANCVEGGATLDDEGRLAAGLNTSRQHFDFTVGSDQLSITGVRADGSAISIMERGRWTDVVLEAMQ